MGREGIAGDRSPGLGDLEVRPVDGHKAVIAYVPLLPSLEVDLCRGRQRRRRGG